jgi:Rps23 Pro-64 3,4-dihydroxylase Tpa1-like proline 4-hydroxylase
MCGDIPTNQSFMCGGELRGEDFSKSNYATHHKMHVIQKIFNRNTFFMNARVYHTKPIGTEIEERLCIKNSHQN